MYNKLRLIKEKKIDDYVDLEIKTAPQSDIEHDLDKRIVVLSIFKNKFDQSIKKRYDQIGDKKVFQEIYPLRIIFSYSPEFDLILTSIEVKMQITQEEVLSNIVGEDSGKRIYLNPSN